MAGVVSEEWDVVHEVGEEDVPAVELRRPEIILPPLVRVGSIVEVATTAN
jgi:hypothetical protein